MDAIEPFGDDRDDLRAAFNTRQLCQAFAGEQPEEWYAEVIEHLIGYIKAKQKPETHVTPRQMRQALGE